MKSDSFMLCESIDNEHKLAGFDGTRYLANVKYDGTRVMCSKKGKEIILFGRGEGIYTHKFQEVVDELKTFDCDFIIDGEVIAKDETFNSTQRRTLTKDIGKIRQLQKLIPVKFMVFDILFFNGEDLRAKPLKERLRILTDKVLSGKMNLNHIFIVGYEAILPLLKVVKEREGEGIVVKDMYASYVPKRSDSWLKFKLFKETTINITGFTENPKGIRATDNLGNAVQVAGYHAQEVKTAMQEDGYAVVNIQYLSKSDTGRYRFPSYRGLAIQGGKQNDK